MAGTLGDESLAGQLLQGIAVLLRRSQPVGDGWRSTAGTAGDESLAGQFLQGRGCISL